MLVGMLRNEIYWNSEYILYLFSNSVLAATFTKNKTRFHFINKLHPTHTNLTQMTPVIFQIMLQAVCMNAVLPARGYISNLLLCALCFSPTMLG